MSKPSAEFLIRVNPGEDWDTATVEVGVSNPEPPFGYWMCMVAYLMHLTAQKSNAGYEGALEPFVKGAMTWRHKEGRVENSDGQ